jgi:hypothetical protein
MEARTPENVGGAGTRATASSRRTRQETESWRLRRLERQRLQNARRRRADTGDDSFLVQESEEQRQRRLQKQRESTTGVAAQNNT